MAKTEIPDNLKAKINTEIPTNDGSIVDFQPDNNKEISISKALGGYEPVNMKIESLEDDFGNIIIDLKN